MKKNMTILILEDDEDILSIIRYILEAQGFHVITGDPMSYKNDIESFHPDLILIDHWLCGIRGGTICETLKADARTRSIPVILTSAANNIEEIARQCGPDDVLPKPFDIDVLVSKVSGCLKGHAEAIC